jgi:butyryl-CoA dehydrogenase
MLAVERPTEDRRRIIKGSDETGCAALKLLEREIQRTIKAARAHAPLHAHVDAPGKACSELTGTVEALLPTLANDSERALANANA